MMHVRVSNPLIKQIDVLARDEERRLGDMVRTLLEDALGFREAVKIGQRSMAI